MSVKDKDTVAVGVRGGPFKYGVLHQFGGTIRMFGKHTVTVPERKFILFQESDKTMINKLFADKVNDSVKVAFISDRTNL